MRAPTATRSATSSPISPRPIPSTAIRSCVRHAEIRNVGLILVTTDKGLCGGLNTNIQRAVLRRSSSGRPTA